MTAQVNPNEGLRITAEREKFSKYMHRPLPLKMLSHAHIIVGIIAWSAVFPEFRKGALLGLGVGSAIEITNKIIDFTAKKAPAVPATPATPSVSSNPATPSEGPSIAFTDTSKVLIIGADVKGRVKKLRDNYESQPTIQAAFQAIIAPELDDKAYKRNYEMVKDLVRNSDDRLSTEQFADAVVTHQVIQWGAREGIKAALIAVTGLDHAKISTISRIFGIVVSTGAKTYWVTRNNQDRRFVIENAIKALANAIIFESAGLAGSLGANLTFSFIRYTALVNSYSNPKTYNLISADVNF